MYSGQWEEFVILKELGDKTKADKFLDDCMFFEAIDEYSKLIFEDSSDPDLYINRGICRKNLEDYLM